MGGDFNGDTHTGQNHDFVFQCTEVFLELEARHGGERTGRSQDRYEESIELIDCSNAPSR